MSIPSSQPVCIDIDMDDWVGWAPPAARVLPRAMASPKPRTVALHPLLLGENEYVVTGISKFGAWLRADSCPVDPAEELPRGRAKREIVHHATPRSPA